jgi:tight adherence protein B
MMSEEFNAPLADEFRRVVAETQLGLPLVSSLERMAVRLQLRDVDWMVQAIRIQQQVGGQLSELLATLAEFMRAREEVRSEVAVLTAEGRISAWVLGAMPIFLFVAVQVINPGYMEPMLQGWGWFWLGLTLAAMGLGMWFILRMVKSVEV